MELRALFDPQIDIPAEILHRLNGSYAKGSKKDFQAFYFLSTRGRNLS